MKQQEEKKSSYDHSVNLQLEQPWLDTSISPFHSKLNKTAH